MAAGLPGNPLEGQCLTADDIQAIGNGSTECATDTPSLP